MNYSVTSGALEKTKTACLVLGIHDGSKFTPAAEAVDKASAGALTRVLKNGDLEGKSGTHLLLQGLNGIAAERVLLIGLGKADAFDAAAYRKALSTAAKAIKPLAAADALNTLTQLSVKGRDARWNLQQAVLATEDALYRFDDCRGKNARAKLPLLKLKACAFSVNKADTKAAQTGLIEARAIAKGVELTKNLANLPGNLCTPTYLAKQAKQLADTYPIKTKVLNRAEMKKLGMGSLLSVAQGSSEPPKLIVMEYLHGPKGGKPIALVGKGLTFDAGGISIKPSGQMDEMKFDMCGGASVFGALAAIAELKLPINVVGIVPSTENLLNGEAVKPGDIVTSMSGITIEVLNTDAEGRLILCDALSYAEKFYAPSQCVNMATLTGACVVALGSHASGLFANDATLGKALLDAGEQTGDRAWELPLWPEYDAQLKSDCADVANIATIGAREAGAIIGATFLHRFTKKMKWAHLDIAGTAWKGKLATGRPVPLLVQYLIAQAAKKNG